MTPTWRPGSAGTDPWAVAPGVVPSGLPAGVAVSGQGSLMVDGLEWLRARVYNPTSRGFLCGYPPAAVRPGLWGRDLLPLVAGAASVAVPDDLAP